MKVFFSSVSELTDNASAQHHALNRERPIDGWPPFENIQLRISLLRSRTHPLGTINQKLNHQGAGESSAAR